jgi:dUTPase
VLPAILCVLVYIISSHIIKHEQCHRITTYTDFSGRVAPPPRLGLTLGQRLDVGAAVVDSHYRAEQAVLLFNRCDKKGHSVLLAVIE